VGLVGTAIDFVRLTRIALMREASEIRLPMDDTTPKKPHYRQQRWHSPERWLANKTITGGLLRRIARITREDRGSGIAYAA